jgi:hypothetical protein
MGLVWLDGVWQTDVWLEHTSLETWPPERTIQLRTPKQSPPIMPLELAEALRDWLLIDDKFNI